MDLVDTTQGQVVLLTRGDELRPLSGVYLPDLIAAITQRYSFAVSPDAKEIDDRAAQFKSGKFVVGNRQANISELSIYNDGVMVSTPSRTDDAELVLKDVLEVSKAYGFRTVPETSSTTVYRSSVIVDFKKPLNSLIEGFAEIAALLSPYYNIDSAPDVGSLTFAADPEDQPRNLGQYNPTVFRMERRVGVPYSDNRYFCEAYMPTTDHLAILEKIENML